MDTTSHRIGQNKPGLESWAKPWWFPSTFLAWCCWDLFCRCLGKYLTHELKINISCSSVFQILVKYKEEWASGEVVQDNRESSIDEEFLELQTERSTEGLSESCVQFMVQAVFFVLLGFFSFFEVGISDQEMAWISFVRNYFVYSGMIQQATFCRLGAMLPIY